MKIMSYPQWCGDMERFYDVMPTWYRSAKSRMAAYDAYHTSARLWNEDEAKAKSRCPECGAVQTSDDPGQDQAHPAQGETQGD